jgi:hypothetical protein
MMQGESRFNQTFGQIYKLKLQNRKWERHVKVVAQTF